MSLRSRFMGVTLLVALLPLLVLATGLRRESISQHEELYASQVELLEQQARQDIEERGARIDRALQALITRLLADNRFRFAVGEESNQDQRYRVDWGRDALGLSGLDVLEVQDSAGRVVTSGHFREQFDRVGKQWPEMSSEALLAEVALPMGPKWVRLRTHSFQMGDQTFQLMGGLMEVDPEVPFASEDFRIHMAIFDASGRPIQTTVDSRDEIPLSTRGLKDPLRREIQVSLLGLDQERVEEGTLRITAPRAPLDARLSRLDRLFLGAGAATVLLALGLAAVASRALSHPLQELADKTTQVAIGRKYVSFRTGRDDEIGDLFRFVGTMVERLQSSAEQLREAERTATVGEIARQVHHDIRNGITPIRNVVRHLSDVATSTPEELPKIFNERSSTIDSGLQYLDTLSTNYARLTPEVQNLELDLNALVRSVAEPLAEAPVDLRLGLAIEPIWILADPVGVRRIVENLIRNAIESLQDSGGRVDVQTRLGNLGEANSGAQSAHDGVTLSVRDSGVGMDEETKRRVFEHFFSTKTSGVGLGLGIVKRLVTDYSGKIELESTPGAGTVFRVWFPTLPRERG